MQKKLLFGLIFSGIISVATLGSLIYLVVFSYIHRTDSSMVHGTVNTYQIVREYKIEEISHQTNIRTKEVSTTATYGSPDESILISADMSGYHNIKKIIIIEAK